MRCISIQILPTAVADFDQHRFLSVIKKTGRTPEIDRFTEKKQDMLLYHFFTERPQPLWQELSNLLFKPATACYYLGDIAIVICDAPDEKGDDLLLYHVDSSEQLDPL